jgi:universal stress protein A
MFQKILLPIDMTDRHGRAVESAARLAAQNNGEIILLHVIEVIPGPSVGEEPSFYGRLEKLATPHLEKFNRLLKSKRIPCRQEIVFGNRGSETVRCARENLVDLIIVTSPQIDPLRAHRCTARSRANDEPPAKPRIVSNHSGRKPHLRRIEPLIDFGKHVPPLRQRLAQQAVARVIKYVEQHVPHRTPLRGVADAPGVGQTVPAQQPRQIGKAVGGHRHQLTIHQRPDRQAVENATETMYVGRPRDAV